MRSAAEAPRVAARVGDLPREPLAARLAVLPRLAEVLRLAPVLRPTKVLLRAGILAFLAIPPRLLVFDQA